jgi:hypothetical protein
MNVASIDQRAGVVKDDDGDATVADKKGATVQTLSELIAELKAWWDPAVRDADVVRRKVEEIDREVERIERRFGRSEPVVLVRLYVMDGKYDRIPAVIDQLDKEELLAVARVLIHALYGSELEAQGPDSDKGSFAYLGGVWYSLDRLTKRLGYLLGAGDDEEAFDVGAAAIEDRWGIIIDALQAHFVADLDVLWETVDPQYRDGWRGNHDPREHPDNALSAAIYQCGDDLSKMPYYRDLTREEVREHRTWLRLGRLPKTSSIVLLSDTAAMVEPKPTCWATDPATRTPATEGDLVGENDDIEIDDVVFQQLLNGEFPGDNFGDGQPEVDGAERPDWQKEGF